MAAKKKGPALEALPLPDAWKPAPKDYETAVAQFDAAKQAWEAAEDYVTSGRCIADLMTNARGDVTKAQEEWARIWADLRLKQEDYNAKRRSAADALRQAVVLTPNQWRGPEGDSTIVTCGAFKVSSVTKRGFDANSLFSLTRQHGLLDRLLELKTFDKESGKEVPLVKQEWDINYQAVLSWLRANKLDDVVTGAYDEKESTPQVKGPKEVYFLGDTKKD